MKIAVLSDTHLGRRNFRKASRILNDIERIGYEQFEKCIKDIIKNKPDLFVFTGDLFHYSSPSDYSIQQAIKTLKLLEEAQIPSRIIAGNHDYNNKNSKLGFHVFKLLESSFNEDYIKFIYENSFSETIEDKSKKYNLSYLPHIHLSYDENGNLLREKYDEEINKLLEFSRKFSPGDNNILFSHGVINSWVDRFIPSTSEENKLKKKNELMISTLLLEDEVCYNYDMTVLGHIHNSFHQILDGKFGKSFRITPGSTMEDNEGSFMIDKDDPDMLNTGDRKSVV